MADEFLSEINRATDIILGCLGFDGEAEIIKLEKTTDVFSGIGRYPDGEEFNFVFDLEPTELESWALEIVLKQLSS